LDLLLNLDVWNCVFFYCLPVFGCLDSVHWFLLNFKRIQF
jgi:hypothetical protein